MGLRSLAFIFWMGLSVAVHARAATCAEQDFETRVSGETQCLLMRRFGPTDPAVMVVWLHGNVSAGGPANSHFKIAQATAAAFAADRLLAVALVRPGYPDGDGEFSSGSDNARNDNWQRQTIVEISAAIERLRLRFKPDKVVLVGHSGGAAIAAVILGMRPQLAQAAVLLACPCDLVAWRAGRGGRPWTSEDPLHWVDKVAPSATVLALTGGGDDTTAPALARVYVQRLKLRASDAVFEVVPDLGHIDLIRGSVPIDAVARVLHPPA